MAQDLKLTARPGFVVFDQTFDLQAFIAKVKPEDDTVSTPMAVDEARRIGRALIEAAFMAEQLALQVAQKQD